MEAKYQTSFQLPPIGGSSPSINTARPGQPSHEAKRSKIDQGAQVRSDPCEKKKQ